MGTVIDLQQARRLRQQRQQDSPDARLQAALSRLDGTVRARTYATPAALVEKELRDIHRLIRLEAIEEAIERIDKLRSRLDHASARRTS